MAITEAQKRAKKKYEEKNRRKTTIDTYKRTTRLYISNHAQEKDLQELDDLIKERRDFLKKS